MKIKVEYGQTLEDIALKYYGALEGVIDLMADNNLGPDSLLYAGQELEIQDVIPDLTDNNFEVQRALQLADLTPHSGIGGETPDGLYVADDYMDEDYV